MYNSICSVLSELNVAFKKLVTFRKKYGVDARTLHLKAILVMTIFRSQKYYALAAKNFQSAVIKQDSWQSFFGLGWSLILSKQQSKVPSIIEAWTGRKFERAADIWLHSLQIKYLGKRSKKRRNCARIRARRHARMPRAKHCWRAARAGRLTRGAAGCRACASSSRASDA